MASESQEVIAAATDAPDSPDAIERQIAEKREAMSSKIDAIGGIAGGGVTGAIQSVADTVGSVTSTIDTVGDTLDRIKKFADPQVLSELIRDTVGSIPLKSTVRKRPWATVGGAAVAGFITGLILTRPRRAAGGAAAGGPTPAGPPSFLTPLVEPIAGMVDRMVDRFGSEVRKVAETAFDSAGAAISGQVSKLLPMVGLSPDGASADLTPPAGGPPNGVTYPSSVTAGPRM